jgi:hypothetical protein
VVQSRGARGRRSPALLTFLFSVWQLAMKKIRHENYLMLLSAQSSFEVAGEAGDGREAVRLVKSLEPDWS